MPSEQEPNIWLGLWALSLNMSIKRLISSDSLAASRALAFCIILLAVMSQVSAQAIGSRKATYISYEDAKPILEAADDVMPQELRGKIPVELARDWPAWVAHRDSDIRARLAQGDADTVVNFLLFGTSYTQLPRITQKQIQEIEQPRPEGGATGSNPALERLVKSLRARADDLIRAASSPGNNDRLVFTKRVLEQDKGFHLDTTEGRERAREYLLASLAKVLSEFSNYAKILAAARAEGPSEEFIQRSSIFRTRGLSLDTTLQPNFAIEETLKAIAARRLLSAGSVRRVAIIGPGLDFTDKQEGYDFYPLQSIQPFAVIDSLLRLGLAKPGELRVTTLDLSPRINDHLRQAKLRVQKGQGYTLHLPFDTQANWRPGLVGYWKRFGDKIATPVPALGSPTNAGPVQVRATRVRPNVVAAITPTDVNIVLQRLDLPATERFDLIIATNILVYYDPFEQSLAAANIERMLRPGGFLLSNNAIPEMPFARIHNVDYTTVVYSDRPGDGDHIVWYQRASD